MPTHHVARVVWTREDAVFVDGRYPRAHRWHFDGGAGVPASSSPHSVRVPLSDPAGVDPEEAFVAALSSCHMLWFLALAARRNLTVDRYEDHAVGTLGRNAAGRPAMTRVVLRPLITWSGVAPDAAAVAALHDEAHHECYIANSVTTEVVVDAPDPA